LQEQGAPALYTVENSKQIPREAYTKALPRARKTVSILASFKASRITHKLEARLGELEKVMVQLWPCASRTINRGPCCLKLVEPWVREVIQSAKLKIDSSQITAVLRWRAQGPAMGADNIRITLIQRLRCCRLAVAALEKWRLPEDDQFDARRLSPLKPNIAS